MMDIKEFLDRNSTESIDRELLRVLDKYAKFYGYDADQLIASVIWFMYSKCNEKNPVMVDPQKALKNWKDECLKAQEVVG